MKRVIVIIINLLPVIMLGQAVCLVQDSEITYPQNDNIKTQGNCNLDYNLYKPDKSTIITKYIRINFHILQKDDGTGNFQNIPAHINYLHSIIDYINNLLSNIPQPMWGGPTNDPYIKNAKIQFVLTNIYFHRDSIGWLNKDTSLFNSYAYDNYKVNPFSEINVFFVEGVPSLGPSGAAPWFSTFINATGFYENYQQPAWMHAIAKELLLHEIGHCLGLWHAHNYQFPDLYKPVCSNYGPAVCVNKGWCSPAIDTLCSNNVMAYSKVKEFLSPMQLGFIHKQLTFGWRKDLLANCSLAGTETIVVDQSIDIDYGI